MASKGITIYTPPSEGPHVYAEDDAQIHRALMAGSGITFADEQLACTVVNNNTVRLASGAYTMQGYIIVVQGGTVADLTVDSGTAGAYRHDLVVADFIRGGGTTADQFTFHVIKGANAASAQAAADPTLIQDDLTAGGSQRQEALYRILINETAIAGIQLLAPVITQMNAEIDTAPTLGSDHAVSSNGTAVAINNARPRYQTLVISTGSWSGSGPYTFTYALSGVSTRTSVQAAAANQATADGMPEPVFVTPSGGQLRFSTIKRPTANLTVALVLQEAAGTTGVTCIAAGAGGGKPYDDFETITLTSGYFSNLRTTMNMVAMFGNAVAFMLDITFTSRYVGTFASIPREYAPLAASTFTVRVIDGSTGGTATLTILHPGEISLSNPKATRIIAAISYEPRNYLPANQSVFVLDKTHTVKPTTPTLNLITKNAGTRTMRCQFNCEFVGDDTLAAFPRFLGLLFPSGFEPAEQVTGLTASARLITGETQNISISVLYPQAGTTTDGPYNTWGVYKASNAKKIAALSFDISIPY